jgi:hypothetical protein
MHFYKRDLTPVREQFVSLSVIGKSPYKQNFDNYEVNITTAQFKDQLLKGMGESVKCIKSSTKNGKQSIQTFTTSTLLPCKLDFSFLNAPINSVELEINLNSH